MTQWVSQRYRCDLICLVDDDDYDDTGYIGISSNSQDFSFNAYISKGGFIRLGTDSSE